ncbi:MAG: hypothetical protein K6T87_11170 [Roseiflexus sp.]|uniref:hypothetical protein n=1 Tax=Roseiflexus sp. TaxID=2562120 RepID=UPI0025DF100F|nr:hypothetical protein [Roseiflexus sp.]MCL6541121.1 hypothetical protein [Roseiflexus sp.]
MQHRIRRRTPRYGQASFQQLLRGISWHWHRPVAPVLRHGARYAVPVLIRAVCRPRKRRPADGARYAVPVL